MKPAISILNPAFTWTPSHATDIRKTFDAERAKQAAERQRQDAQRDAAKADLMQVIGIFDARKAKP